MASQSVVPLGKSISSLDIVKVDVCSLSIDVFSTVDGISYKQFHKKQKGGF